MSAQVVSIVWWVVGSFGVGGLIACWFVFPTVSQLVLKAVISAFQFVLSYRIGCALLAAIVAGLIADQRRHSYDDEQFAKRTAAFEQAQDARDNRIAKETREKVWAEIANATAANAVTDSNVKVFTDALPPSPATGNPFLISDADAARLCQLAGQTQCGSSGDKGMPKARRASGSAANKKVRLPSLIRTGTWTDQKGQ